MEYFRSKVAIIIGSSLFVMAIAAIVLFASSARSGTASPPVEARLSPLELTPTEVVPVATPSPTEAPPTATPVVPTATAVPPTATRVPPTPTPIPPTATRIPPTATRVPPTATPIPPTPVPPSSVYLGAWVQEFPNNPSSLTAFQNAVGRKMAIVMWYQGWAGQDVFNQNLAQSVANQGSVPLVTWEPWDYRAGSNQPAYSTANIAAGNFDGFITAYAQSVKNYGKPVFLRFAHEMNARRYPWAVGVNGNSAQSYVAAWRRVHDIFVHAGATNVLWVWSPNVKYEGTAPFASVYPGDNYVDWMGLDGYNGGTALPWGGWQSFGQIFTASYQDLVQFNQKPIMIAETASVEQGGSKAAWINDAMLTQMPQRFPRVRAFVWFNENRAGEADWRLESSAAAFGAYVQAAASPYFKSSADGGIRG